MVLSESLQNKVIQYDNWPKNEEKKQISEVGICSDNL